jgi:hypothetical protein
MALLLLVSSLPLSFQLLSPLVSDTMSGSIGLPSLVRSDLVNNVSIVMSTHLAYLFNIILASFDGEAPYIKYPVLVVAGAVAVVQALPLLVSSIWRSASTALGRSRPARFTTRDSFARGRGDYAAVDDDGELLGDESDEEV